MASPPLPTTQAGDQVEVEVTVWAAGQAGLGELLQPANKLRSFYKHLIKGTVTQNIFFLKKWSKGL